MPAASRRKRFQEEIEEQSDIILTGHEHEPEAYEKISSTGEKYEYIEGAVFQDKFNAENSGFYAIIVDTTENRHRNIHFSWKDHLFRSSGGEGHWKEYSRGSKRGRRDFELAANFKDKLNDPEITFTHPRKAKLELPDIFVCPNLRILESTSGVKQKEDHEKNIVESRDVFEEVTSKPKVIIYGRSQSGKSTLAKNLFLHLYRSGLTPVFVHGANLRPKDTDLNTSITIATKDQYTSSLLPEFYQLGRDKVVLIIDDFDQTDSQRGSRAKILGLLSERYDRIIIFSEDFVRFESLVKFKSDKNPLDQYESYEILPFGHLLREQLITNWLIIGRESARSESLQRNIREMEVLINGLLGKDYVPSFPLFLLTLIHAHEAQRHLNSSVGTFGGLYELLITDALAKCKTQLDLDLRMTYLSELANGMYKKGRAYLLEDEWIIFHQEYCAKFTIKPSRKELEEIFYDSNILFGLDGTIRFVYTYAYYFFIARYMRDNLSDSNIRSLIAELCKTIYRDQDSSILLFLTHQSKDPYIVGTLLQHSKSIFRERLPVDFNSDTDFFKRMSQDIRQLVLVTSDNPLNDKQEQLRHLDSTESRESAAESGIEDTNEIIAQLNLAFKTLDVLGQLVKNFPGSLVGSDKLDIVTECYELGFRTMRCILSCFENDSEEFLRQIMSEVTKKNNSIQNYNKQGHERKIRGHELESRINRIVVWMMEISCFGMIKRISSAVGHPYLNETYRAVLARLNTHSASLVDISTKLDNIEIPEKTLLDLRDKFRGNALCERLLRYLVIHHMYMFSTPLSTRHKLCEALDISIQSVKTIELKSHHTKIVRS